MFHRTEIFGFTKFSTDTEREEHRHRTDWISIGSVQSVFGWNYNTFFFAPTALLKCLFKICQLDLLNLTYQKKKKDLLDLLSSSG